MSDRAVRGAVAAGVLVLALATAACSESSAARDNCLEKAFFVAKANAVRTEFNAGRLGTPKQVERQLVRYYRLDGGKPVDLRAVKRDIFFDANGKIIPWSRLTFRQKTELDEWMSHSQQVNERLRNRYPHLWEHVKATAKC
jgi:hypothetical protein